MEVPGKLLAGNLNNRGVCRSIREINRGPHPLPHEHENSEDHCRHNQENGLGLRIVVPVRRAFIRVLSISCYEVAQCALNENKSDAADDEYSHEKAVDARAVLG